MCDIRIHGRGGQGTVAFAEILARAAVRENKFAQALFPDDAAERRGAPVQAFVRIAESRVRERNALLHPNVVVVLDPSLLRVVRVTGGLLPGGTLVVNSHRNPDDLRVQLGTSARIAVYNAESIAHEGDGNGTVNASMLGALLAAVPVVSAEKAEGEIGHRFAEAAEKYCGDFWRAFLATNVRAAVPLADEFEEVFAAPV